MTSSMYRGELFLTLEEAAEYNKNLEKACLEIYGFKSGFVPWRICAIDQSVRAHTPSSLSLLTALRELDATVDPSTIINQPLNRRSSYRLDSPPVRSPPSASPPPPEIKVEPKPIKVEEKIEFDPESDIYKLLHPCPDKLNTLPQWLQSVHKILKVLCYMPEIKPFLKYFNYNKAGVDPNNEPMDLDKNGAKSDKMDDLGFDVLTDDLDDILMDIDSIGPSTSRSSGHENSKDFEDEIKLESEFANVDDSVKHEEGVNDFNGSTSHTHMDSDKLSSDLNDSRKSDEQDISNAHDLNNAAESNEHHPNDQSHTSGHANHSNGPDSADLFKSTEDLTPFNRKAASSDVNDSIDLSLTNDTADSNVDNEANVDTTTTQVRFDSNTTEHTDTDSPFKHALSHGKRTHVGQMGFEYVLENILDNNFENSSYLFSVLYCYLLYQLKLATPGSREWMCAQVLAGRLDDLRRENQLKDAEKLHNFPDPERPEPVVLPPADLQSYSEPKKPRTSMDDFEHELALINNVNDYSPTISLPEVKSITDEERMEFYENAMLLDQEFQLELFTVFEHAAVWKLVGNGEIELDDQNTDPKIYRGMIKWVKEKRTATPTEAKEEALEMPTVSSEIVV